MENNVVDIKLLGVYGFAQCKTAQVAKELIPRTCALLGTKMVAMLIGFG